MSFIVSPSAALMGRYCQCLGVRRLPFARLLEFQHPGQVFPDIEMIGSGRFEPVAKVGRSDEALDADSAALPMMPSTRSTVWKASLSGRRPDVWQQSYIADF